MNISIYQVDAFTDKLFGGNPAAVCPLDFWPEDHLMQSIAMENNLAETAFFCKEGEDYRLRWFTPLVEVDLCGHATLASAHVIYEELGYTRESITFQSKSGPLMVSRIENATYLLDFPSDHALRISDQSLVKSIASALGTEILELWRGRDDYMAVVSSEKIIRTLNPDFRSLKKLDSRGLIVTSPGEELDFVSRGFFPQCGIDEDPATGSAHTVLTPYWAPRLKNNSLHAQQISRRVGHFKCIYKGERTALIGKAVSYLKGQITVG
jgi:PhzF family phenazine biosynthesis protein